MFLPSALTSTDYSCHVWWGVRPSRGGFRRRAVVSNVELLPFGTAVARRLKRPLCIAISPYNSRIRIVLRQTTTDKVNMKLKAKRVLQTSTCQKLKISVRVWSVSRQVHIPLAWKKSGEQATKTGLHHGDRLPAAFQFSSSSVCSAVHNQHLSRDHPSPLLCEHSCDSLYHGRWYLYSIHYRYFT